MMRLWKESYTKSSSSRSSAIFSLVAHGLLIAGAITATQRSAGVVSEWIENRVYYLPPPDRRVQQQESHETLRYIALAPEGLGSGSGSANVETDRGDGTLSPSIGDLGRDLTSSPEAPALAGSDSVFTELEVDSTVTRYPGSAAPAYPLSMLKAAMQGSVVMQYVVDTTGFADTSSFHVVSSTHEDFTAAVRAALPFMRFSPAKVGPRRVRQLVEQEFSFKIDQAATQTGDARKPDSLKPQIMLLASPQPHG